MRVLKDHKTKKEYKNVIFAIFLNSFVKLGMLDDFIYGFNY